MNLNFKIDALKTFEDVRDALQKVREAFQASALTKADWKFVEIEIVAPVDTLTYSHRLTFTPKDVLQVSVSNGAQITWHYDDFDDKNVALSASAACTVRAYIGRHRETP